MSKAIQSFEMVATTSPISYQPVIDTTRPWRFQLPCIDQRWWWPLTNLPLHLFGHHLDSLVECDHYALYFQTSSSLILSGLFAMYASWHTLWPLF
jgi:hypothetical protein